MSSYQSSPDRFDDLLLRYFQSQHPDSKFLAQLRHGLLSARPVPRIKAIQTWRTSMGANWRYALVAALILLCATVAAIGPGKVLAQIEHWLGYSPGLGAVDLAASRVLVRPVSRSEGGITLQVEQFVASQSETLVKIDISGLPGHVSPSTQSIFIQWESGNGQRSGLRMRKAQVIPTYPTCPTEGCPPDLQPNGYTLLSSYEALPADVDKVQVLWQTWGMVPGVSVTDTWNLDIPLEAVSRQNTQSVMPGYAPPSAEASHDGIRVMVKRVFANALETVVDASIMVPEPAGPVAPRARGST